MDRRKGSNNGDIPSFVCMLNDHRSHPLLGAPTTSLQVEVEPRLVNVDSSGCE